MHEFESLSSGVAAEGGTVAFSGVLQGRQVREYTDLKLNYNKISILFDCSKEKSYL